MRVSLSGVPVAPFLAGLLVFVAAACSTSSSDDIKVRVVTPASRANAPVYALAGTPTPFPTPQILLSAENVYQAGTVLVSVTGPVANGSVTFISRTYTLTKGTQSMYAFVGVEADDPPGHYPLSVSYSLPNGSKGTLPGQTVTVLKTNWTVDSVIVGPSLVPLLDPAVGEAEAAHQEVADNLPNDSARPSRQRRRTTGLQISQPSTANKKSHASDQAHGRFQRRIVAIVPIAEQRPAKQQ